MKTPITIPNRSVVHNSATTNYLFKKWGINQILNNHFLVTVSLSIVKVTGQITYCGSTAPLHYIQTIGWLQNNTTNNFALGKNKLANFLLL
jgi:hypothetical protein